jgi:prevent-host-death family protein
LKNNKFVFFNLAEAKAKFSKVIEETKNHDVVITKNGLPSSVIINYEKYIKILNFLDKVWELYLLDVGDPSLFGKLDIEDIFNEKDD